VTRVKSTALLTGFRLGCRICIHGTGRIDGLDWTGMTSPKADGPRPYRHAVSRKLSTEDVAVDDRILLRGF
jgi:hypothetical protein